MVITTQVKENRYAYHMASKDDSKILSQRDALIQALPSNALNVLYYVHVLDATGKSFEAVQKDNEQLKKVEEVTDAKEFTKLVFDRKLLRLADKLQYREMNNLDQLIDWFNEN